MLLCADIGNSHTTIGLLDGGVVVDHWRMATDERRQMLRTSAAHRSTRHWPGRAR